jgi:cytoskeletal protein RodZ
MSKSNKADSSQEHALKSSEPKDLGSYLKSLRDQHKISLEQLSKHLKIRVSNLEAIENNEQLSHIPLAYYRGYIKNYCMFFGVDPEPILDNLPKSSISDNVPKPVYNSGQAFLFSLAESRGGANRKSLLASLPYRTILTISLLGMAVFMGIKFLGNKRQENTTHNYVSHGLSKTRLQKQAF